MEMCGNAKIYSAKQIYRWKIFSLRELCDTKFCECMNTETTQMYMDSSLR